MTHGPAITTDVFEYLCGDGFVMKLDITKEWFEKHAHLEGDMEIGAGRRFPPAYDGCTCACHHSPMMHVVACCNPSSEESARIRELLGIEDDVAELERWLR